MSSRHVNTQMLLMAAFYRAEQQGASWRRSPERSGGPRPLPKGDTTHWQLVSKRRTKVSVGPKKPSVSGAPVEKKAIFPHKYIITSLNAGTANTVLHI